MQRGLISRVILCSAPGSDDDVLPERISDGLRGVPADPRPHEGMQPTI